MKGAGKREEATSTKATGGRRNFQLGDGIQQVINDNRVKANYKW